MGGRGFNTFWGRPLHQLNEYPLLDKSKRESLKCLTKEKAPFLKDLLSEDALVNVSLKLADPEGNNSCLFSHSLF